MPNAPGQPAYDREISTFVEWVRDQSIKGTLGSDPDVKHPFMPLARLENYLKEKDGDRTKRLLRASFPNSDPPIEPEDVWRNSIRVFSILLLIRKVDFIPAFVQHDQLWDSKLPFFSPPRHFPPAPGDDGFFASFCKQQWHFYPHTFQQNVIKAQLEREYILPIVYKEQLGDGGSATTYKIRLHPAYDHLKAPMDIRSV
jgi:hypothetical protein